MSEKQTFLPEMDENMRRRITEFGWVGTTLYLNKANNIW